MPKEKSAMMSQTKEGGDPWRDLASISVARRQPSAMRYERAGRITG